MSGGLGAMEILIILTPMVLFIFSLVDVLRSKFEGNNKLIWVLVIIFVPFLGAIIYLTIGRKQKIE